MTTTVKEELLAIAAASADGLLHAREVVAWAKDHEESALHAAMEWDDEVAAHQHRLAQARRLIEIHVCKAGPTSELFVSLSIDRIAGGGYRPVSEVVQMPNLREVMLRDALADLGRMQTRYQQVQELSAVWTALGEVREREGQEA